MWRFRLLRQASLQTAIIPNKHGQSGQSAYCRPQAGSTGCERQAARQQVVGEGQHRDDPQQLFDDLRHRGRRHQLPALQIAAQAGNQRNQKNRRRQGNNRIIGPRLADNLQLNQPTGAKIQQQAEQQAGNGHQQKRQFKYPCRACIVFQRRLFRRDDRDRDRDPGVRNAKRQQVERERDLINADPFAAEHPR